MKKFVLMAIMIILAMLGLYYAVYYQGYYISYNNNDINVIAVAKEKRIYLKNEAGEEIPFEIKGVSVSPSIPGHYMSDYAVDEKTWLKWFEEIQAMGANTIRIYNVYDDTFYNAYYKYNINNQEPLYLLQGIQVSDYANNSSEDAYSKNFYYQLKQDGKTAVDVIHGRKNIMLNTLTGSGNYRKDVSKWVLGYLVGTNWNSGTVAYTNHNKTHKKDYDGTYFSTDENADAFEALLADIMDTIVSYEIEKYSQSRLVSFINDPSNDPFEYDIYYAKQKGKYNCIDAENIKLKSQDYQGYFVAYELYEFCPEFTEYFSDIQKYKLAQMLPYINKEFYYEGYTQLLSEYHTMPVVIAGYGYSTARGTDTPNGRYSEYAQGEKLLSTYNDIVNSGCAGAFIDTWQDTWDRISWNTSYAVDILDNKKWHDVQTMGESSGILAFKLGKEDIVYIDGDIKEWQDIKPVFKSENMSLYAQYDAEYIYIMLSGDKVSEENIFYLPIDTIQTQGSKTIADIPEVEFEREADFLIYIGGKENSHILVQERYDSLRENYLEKITGEDPFYIHPEKNSNIFVPIRMLLKNENMALEIMTDEEVQQLSYFKAYETGYLSHGNANPSSEKYNSLADFCYGDKCIEIRIPWAILNFSNPADMKIHKDYYENYGREDMVISEFYIGVADSSVKNIKMNKVELKGWDRDLDYHQRLKKSYYILQEGWKKR